MNNGRFTPITRAVAGVGNRVSNGQHASDSFENHDYNDSDEVIHSNNDHREFPVITGRFDHPVNWR